MKKLHGVLYYTAKTRPEDLAKPYPPPMTNADRIRSMTDEELAEFLPGHEFGDNCPPEEPEECPIYCVSCWLKWLKQEVQE